MTSSPTAIYCSLLSIVLVCRIGAKGQPEPQKCYCSLAHVQTMCKQCITDWLTKSNKGILHVCSSFRVLIIHGHVASKHDLVSGRRDIKHENPRLLCSNSPSGLCNTRSHEDFCQFAVECIRTCSFTERVWLLVRELGPTQLVSIQTYRPAIMKKLQRCKNR